MTILSPDTGSPDTGSPESGVTDGVLSDAGAMGTRTGAADLDPLITGPMPAVDLLDGHLHVSERRGVTIVAIDGGLDDALAELVTPTIEVAIAGSDAVILDLDRVTLLDRSALERICATIDAAPSMPSRCVVAARLSGRLVLDRWDIPESFAVFNSVADALQARTFIESGYGNGWGTSQD